MIEYRKVSLIRRLWAIVYDLILLAAILMIASGLATSLLYFVTGSSDSSKYNLLMTLWLLFAGFLYYGISWKVSGQTVGMRTWRFRVLNADGSHLSLQQSFYKYILTIILFSSLIGFIWLLFDKNKRTLYDILTDTIFVNEKPLKK